MSAAVMSGLTLLFCIVFWELVVRRMGCAAVILMAVMLAGIYVELGGK